VDLVNLLLSSSSSPIAIGDSFPSGITLFEYKPPTDGDAGGIKEVKTDDIIINNGKVVIFGLPGAFTPGCTQKHLPSFVKRADEIRSNGYSEIVCIAVNDPFVMYNWGAANGATGKIRMLGDPEAKLAKALGLDNYRGPAMGIRSKRYSAVAEGGKITQLNVEAGAEIACSLAPELKL